MYYGERVLHSFSILNFPNYSRGDFINVVAVNGKDRVKFDVVEHLLLGHPWEDWTSNPF